MVNHAFATVNADGTPVSKHRANVNRIGLGVYEIFFEPAFSSVPAIVGSQTRWDHADQSSLDNIAFPFVSKDGATAVLGSNTGDRDDRPFSFIAVGE